jgi:hypothetical protein
MVPGARSEGPRERRTPRSAYRAAGTESPNQKKALSTNWMATPEQMRQGLFYTDKKSPQLIHRRDQMSVAEVNRLNRELAALDQNAAQDALKRRCTGYGFTPNTDAHSRCVMDLVQGNQVRATAAAEGTASDQAGYRHDAGIDEPDDNNDI